MSAKGNRKAKPDPAARPPQEPGVVERFPKRVGRRLVQDRQLTPAELRAAQEEADARERARSYRQRKQAERDFLGGERP